MALSRPSLPISTIMDALEDNGIVFESFGGDRVTSYDVEIRNNEDGKIAYSASESNIASNVIHIQAGILNNGFTYQISVRTRNSAGDYSNWSDPGIIMCYKTPVCTINNIEIVGNDFVVPDQNFIFIGSYKQNEDVQIQKYQYFLYDSEKVLIQEFSSVIFEFITSDDNLTQRVEGFDPDTVYHIEIRCTDINGLTVSSGLIRFIAQYEVPRIRQELKLENEKETASVKISTDMIQIIFKLEDGAPATYINEQELQLFAEEVVNGVAKRTKEYTAYVDEYLNIPMNFTLKIYCRGIQTTDIGTDKFFLSLTSEDGLTKIQMKECEGRIHVYKTTTLKLGGSVIRSHYISNVIEGYTPEKSYVVIQINHSNGRIDVFAQVTEMVA